MKLLSVESHTISLIRNQHWLRQWIGVIRQQTIQEPKLTQTYIAMWCHQATFNWPDSQIPECTCSISHNAPFRTEMCTFLFWMGHCGICYRCILGFLKLLYWHCYTLSPDIINCITADELKMQGTRTSLANILSFFVKNNPVFRLLLFVFWTTQTQWFANSIGNTSYSQQIKIFSLSKSQQCCRNTIIHHHKA